jgi:hypothetical protein
MCIFEIKENKARLISKREDEEEDATKKSLK